jgi:hypothetical protein
MTPHSQIPQTAPAASRPRTRSRTGGIVALVIGAVLTVCGPVLGILIGSFALVPSALGYAEDTARLAPTAIVELDAGESVYLLAPVADLGAADHGACRAEARDGSAATVSHEPASALNVHADGSRYESFARVTADERGAYTLSCDADVDVIAAPPFELGSFFGPFGWWTAGGLLVSLVGIDPVIVGIVRLVTRAPQPVHA